MANCSNAPISRKIESYTGEQKVLYTKETIDKDYASVRTEIVVKRDANVEVEYRLLRRNGNWQVYDVVIEGCEFGQQLSHAIQ